MVKILLTIPNFDTAGSGRALLNLATRLDRGLFEPHLCCMHDRGDFFPRVRASRLPVHLVQYTTPMRPATDGLRGCWRTSRFFRQFDLVHSFHYSDDYSEGLAARMAGVRWIYVKKNMSWGSRAWRVRTALAHAVIAQNTDMMQRFFAGSRKAIMIPRGVDTTEFQPRPPAPALLRELALPEDSRVVLAVANLVPVKGIEHLIDAFVRIAGAHPLARLIIVGDTTSAYAGQLKQQAEASPVAARIVFTGKRPDVQRFHGIASVFILPTLGTGEGSPVSLIEAMAAGTPVIATNVAGIRDQLSDLPEQLVEPGDVSGLAARLEWALRLSPAQALAISSAQRRIVEERYSIAHEVALHERLYQRIMENQVDA